MADERQFKFVSPGIFVNEIDNSQLPEGPTSIGPVIIGRLPKGPALRPITVNSFAEFVETFGNPVPGKQGGDVWRDGNQLGPTYAAYAAQAWLRNTPGATIVRVLGRAHNDGSGAVSNGVSPRAIAGWQVGYANVGSSLSGSEEQGGAYGLFICQPSTDGDTDGKRGVLAAIFYCQDGYVQLSGSGADASSAALASARATQAGAAAHEYRIIVKKNASDAIVADAVVNFDPNSDKYIRDRFNTNPTLLNTAITPTDDQKTYFLGQTYDRAVWDVVGECSAANGSQAFILGLRAQADDTLDVELSFGAHKRNTQPSRSGWVIAQDITSNYSEYNAADMQKLFRFEGLDNGEWCQNNIKITIEDVKYSENPTDPYGTFTVAIRRIDDNDGSRKNIERFGNLSLNPNSPNYIARRIGDRYYEWVETERRYRAKGNYPNMSRYVRVQMNASVDDGATDPTYLPFGFFSNPRLLGFTLEPADTVPAVYDDSTSNVAFSWVMGDHASTAANKIGGCSAGGSAKFVEAMFNYTQYNICWPAMPMRSSSKSGSLPSPKRACFGFDTTRKTTAGAATKIFDPSVKDIARAFPSDGTGGGIIYSYAPDGVDADAGAVVTTSYTGSLQQNSEETDFLAPASNGDAASATTNTSQREQPKTEVFSLDDVVQEAAGSAHAKWVQGSRKTGQVVGTNSYTAVNASAATVDTLGIGYKAVLDAGFDKFTLCMFGGFDGLDIAESEPFRNSATKSHAYSEEPPLNGRTELTSYAFNSVKMAMDSCADPDVVQANGICAPGITNPDLTTHAIEIAESRGDMIAVVDLEGDYVPTTEAKVATRGLVTGSNSVVSKLQDRSLNNSYGCAYYPWVQIMDTLNNAVLWAPPSIAALGVFSSTDRNEELWFAPAGFTRGGLSANGAAGIPVLGVRQRLTSKERDRLYANNINPIAQFPAEGIVIFGQKTLQVTKTALDRVNVRRLLIFLKREISKLAATTLFDQNVQATWSRFKGPAELLLASVKSRYGLSAYKLILDETTTTPDLIDRNIMYAKILLAPTKAIEFIALDFVITRSGASFED